MQTDEALDRVRAWSAGTGALTEPVTVALAAAVIGMRAAETDVASAWGQHRDNPHIPADLRRALEAFVAQRSS